MSKQDKPLPKPPKTPFGKKKRFEHDKEKTPLLADEMAMAMAKGTLDDFIQREVPDNEHARKLVEMMMGMTGMMPSGGGTKGEKAEEQKSPREKENVSLPDDVMKAVMSGNTNDVMELLKREHEKRNPGTGISSEKKEKKVSPDEITSQEKELAETLKKIADDNSVSVDWLMMRALKLYIQQYRESGKL
jgi:hypothetical protein